MSRYTKGIDYISMFFADIESLIITGHRNLCADLEAGYSLDSKAIKFEKDFIADCEKRRADAAERFKTMTDEEANRWAYYDLLKRGAIE